MQPFNLTSFFQSELQESSKKLGCISDVLQYEVCMEHILVSNA